MDQVDLIALLESQQRELNIQKNIEKAKKATYKNFYLIGKELNELGINFNCAPVLDLFVKNSNIIIGSRAFSRKLFSFVIKLA